MNDPSRLEAIEIKLAHLENALQQLGQAVVHQQRELERLAAANRALREQLEILEGTGASAEQFEKPPHY
jgi:uncharacterized coiled-coil protein SlyX